jgi:hypothetical protein
MKSRSTANRSKSGEFWPRLCAFAVALSLVGCGTTPRSPSPEATVAPQQAQATEPADKGTNEGSASAVRTVGRVAGATAVGVAGAAGGAALGALGGLGYSAACGPAIIFCAPVMMVGGAIVGGVAGGVGGAAFVWKHTAAEPVAAPDPVATDEPVETRTVATDSDASPSGETDPDPSPYLETPSDSSPETESEREIPSTTVALAAPSAMAVERTEPASAVLPAAGTIWRYEFSDRMYGKQASVTVRVAGVFGEFVDEQLSVLYGSTARPPLRRDIQARTTRFAQYTIDNDYVLTEFAPYLFAAGGEEALREVAQPDGYPTAGDSDWVTQAAPPEWERVTVPAGTFKALRLEISGRRKISPFSPIAVYRFSIIVWYAPEVKRYVKLEHKTWLSEKRQYGDEVVELVEFRPGA